MKSDAFVIAKKTKIYDIMLSEEKNIYNVIKEKLGSASSGFRGVANLTLDSLISHFKEQSAGKLGAHCDALRDPIVAFVEAFKNLDIPEASPGSRSLRSRSTSGGMDEGSFEGWNCGMEDEEADEDEEAILGKMRWKEWKDSFQKAVRANRVDLFVAHVSQMFPRVAELRENDLDQAYLDTEALSVWWFGKEKWPNIDTARQISMVCEHFFFLEWELWLTAGFADPPESRSKKTRSRCVVMECFCDNKSFYHE